VRMFLEKVGLLLQGKFIRINFDISGYIAGANIETCILDFMFLSAAASVIWPQVAFALRSKAFTVALALSLSSEPRPCCTTHDFLW